MKGSAKDVVMKRLPQLKEGAFSPRVPCTVPSLLPAPSVARPPFIHPVTPQVTTPPWVPRMKRVPWVKVFHL